MFVCGGESMRSEIVARDSSFTRGGGPGVFLRKNSPFVLTVYG